MTSVAFFRNLNLGQARSHSPTRPQLLEAMAAAGARDGWSFQVNGTVVFAADGDPQAVADRAVELLGPVCGYAGPVVVRPLAWLRALELPEAPGAELALFDGPDPFPEQLPWVGADGGATVVAADARHAVVLNADPARGFATWLLEQRLGVPVTSRGAGTVRRLLARVDRPVDPSR